MKDISIYFSPIERLTIKEDTLGASIKIHDANGFPEINKNSIAFFSVPEYRRTSISSVKDSAEFREDLYDFYKGDSWSREVYDLGVINPGEQIEDTYFAVSQVVAELVKIDVIPIVLGGGQDLTLACYKGFGGLEQAINICSVDAKLDIGEPDGPVSSSGFVSHMLMQRPCHLFNYANVGMQRLKVPRKEVDLFEKLYFDICRLGEFNTDFKKAEPHLRNADMLSVDFDSVRNSETDSKVYSNPNGFYGDQFCQIAKYAGISDKMSCLGIYNIHPDQNKAAAKLLVEFIWYFMDGVALRVGDFPIGGKNNYKKFFVHLEEFEDDLVFYKSDKSGRWWLEVRYPGASTAKYDRHQLVPCDQSDYEDAMRNVIPDLWWRTLQKLS
jgi:formiminoglutamase